MSIGTGAAIALGIGGAVAGAGSIASSVIGANAAKTAASQQVSAEEQALQFQQQVYNTNQGNLAPWLTAGQGTIGQLSADISNGTFGPGSIPPFTLPTLSTAEQTPGFQFEEQQGDQGILAGNAAAGGAFTGGTLKELANYNQGLATTTYQTQVQNALAAYNAQLSGQQQGYNQIAGVASLGENAAAQAGNQGVASAAQVGTTLGNIGTAQASGTVGTANAITGGIGSISNLAQLYALIGQGGGGIFPGGGTAAQGGLNSGGNIVAPPGLPGTISNLSEIPGTPG